MSIKTVFGLFQGNKNKQVAFIDQYVEKIEGSDHMVNIYQILAKDDRSFCIEKDKVLYRICADYQKDQLKQLIDQKCIFKQINRSVNRVIDFLATMPDQIVRGDANLFYLLDKSDQYQKLLKHNKEIDKIEEQEKEKAQQIKEEKERTEEKEVIKKAIDRIIEDDIKKYIDNKELSLLIKAFDIKVHPRTLGFINNSLQMINSKNQLINKGSKGSQKAFIIYNEIKEKIKQGY